MEMITGAYQSAIEPLENKKTSADGGLVFTELNNIFEVEYESSNH